MNGGFIHVLAFPRAHAACLLVLFLSRGTGHRCYTRAFLSAETMRSFQTPLHRLWCQRRAGFISRAVAPTLRLAARGIDLESIDTTAFNQGALVMGGLCE